MKKLIAFAIAAIMVLSMIPAMAFTVSADEAESNLPDPFSGFWTVYRDPDDYKADAEYYKPSPAYKYTSEGFQLTSADYTNMTPKWTVQTSQPQDLTQGFYMQVRIDEFSYKGTGDTPADEWISFSISDRPLVAHGNTVHGNNWLSLVRGAGDGNASLQSFVTEQTTETSNGGFFHKGDVNTEVPMDEDGKEIYTFEVVYDGTNYDIKINGVSLLGAADYTTAIKGYEECYIGFTFHSGVKDGVASATILKQGTSASDATTPDGTDEGEAEDNILNFADPTDINTIPANTPALMWNAEKQSFKGDPNANASSMVLTPTANNTYHCQSTGGASYFMWGIKADMTINAPDAPIYAMLMKDYMGNDGMIRYATGDVMSADDTHMTGWSLYDDNARMYGENEEYSLVIVDFSAEGVGLDWEGRINSIRTEFATDPGDEEYSQWEVCYIGMFRTIEEAYVYTENLLKTYGIDPDATVEETQAPTDPADEETQAPTTDNGGEGETKDNAGEGETSGTTNAPTTGDDKGDDKADEGCASVIGMSAVILMAAAAAVVLKKKD